MNHPSDLQPGIYGAPERWVSDSQLQNIADHVRSIESIRMRMSKITPGDRLGESFVGELEQAIIDFIVPRGITLSAGDTLEIFRLLRDTAHKER
jgi:hypothetical protein